MDYIRRHRNTILPPAGRKITVVKKPTSGDLKIFRTLDPGPGYGYRFLPSHYINHFTGGSKLHQVKRLGVLKEEQNAFIYWPEQQKYSENAWMTAALSDIIPVYPFVGAVMFIGDWLVVNPYYFWGKDAWDNKGTAYVHSNPNGANKTVTGIGM